VALYPVLLLLLHTGMRAGEVFALRWSNIVLEERIIHVRETLSRWRDDSGVLRTLVGTPKTEKSIRDISISLTDQGTLQKIRARQPEMEDIVFPTKLGTFLSLENFHKTWERLLNDLSIRISNSCRGDA